MAESGACLMRSFTHPSNSLRESQEFQGDTFRALTDSVSFGRFMSESLAWEKWSTFSHNRYLEEVEQFSKPGSVAQKKAFFEAHYKKRAAMKAAAAVAEATTEPVAAPAVANEISTDCSSDVRNSVSVVCPVDDVVMAIEEQQNSGNDSEETSSCGDENVMDNSTSSVEEDEHMIVKEPEVELDEEQNKVETTQQVENADEMKQVTPIMKEAAAELEDVDIQSNKRRKSSASSSSKSGTTTTITTSRFSISKSAAKQKTSSSSQTKAGTKKTVGVGEEMSIEKKRTAPKAIHMSINFASKLWETGKSSLRKPRELATAPKNAAPKASVHQDQSKLRASSMMARELPPAPKIAATKASDNQSKLRASSVLARDLATAPKNAATKASVNHDQSKLSASSMMATRQADDRSSNSKSSGTSGSKARPPLLSSPFSFRSEERAARRREILEERNKLKEAEKLQLQAKSKEKNEHYMRSLRQSTTAAFRARPIEDSGSGSQSFMNSHTRKLQIPLTRPRSPKLGRKPSPGVSMTSDSSKSVVPKNRPSTNRSSVSILPKRKTHENASPNIQL
ncbi:unnamed protein product [Linum tenue]|uniref:TPX2 C-terminal domain-containing protein n=1 Tax=Linum tenue TaxID=586396 RepID=A0AAV0KUX4_9ROSI|nr:unnamed protein product [Linum tenue]